MIEINCLEKQCRTRTSATNKSNESKKDITANLKIVEDVLRPSSYNIYVLKWVDKWDRIIYAKYKPNTYIG